MIMTGIAGLLKVKIAICVDYYSISGHIAEIIFKNNFLVIMGFVGPKMDHSVKTVERPKNLTDK